MSFKDSFLLCDCCVFMSTIVHNTVHWQETALENERKKAEKLEEKCEALTGQIDRLKVSLEENETSRRKIREELEVEDLRSLFRSIKKIAENLIKFTILLAIRKNLLTKAMVWSFYLSTFTINSLEWEIVLNMLLLFFEIDQLTSWLHRFLC